MSEYSDTVQVHRTSTIVTDTLVFHHQGADLVERGAAQDGLCIPHFQEIPPHICKDSPVTNTLMSLDSLCSLDSP
jgi:hypothetical protein